MKFEQKKVLAEDVNVSYFDEGTNPGVPIIFIHGFPFNKVMWEDQLDLLKDNYRVLAYDVRGHGDSNPGVQQFSILQFVADLFLFMDALYIKKAIVCGLSMGGYIALKAVQENPDRIAGLILCDTQCTADSEEAKKKRSATIEAVQANGLKQYAEDSVERLFSKSSHASKKQVVSGIEGTILHTPVETIVNTLMALAERAETCSSLHLIKVPVLIMVGAEDEITPPEAARKMHQLIPNSELQILEKSGHVSNLEVPEIFNSHLQVFLKEVSPNVIKGI
jgi:3-oxoadipate enol-lactonase